MIPRSDSSIGARPRPRRGRRPTGPRWVVVNQSLSPAFQAMVGALTESFGPCLLYTGTPHDIAVPDLTVEKGPAYDRRGIARRAGSWAAFVAAAASRLARLPGRPFVLAVTNPPFVPHLARAMHGWRGGPFGVLVWDLYPEHIVQQGWVSPESALVRGWLRANESVYGHASPIITLGERMAEAIRAQLPTSCLATPVDVIPNWADTDSITPIAKRDNSFAIAHGQLDKTTVLYAGNIGASHSLHTLIDAAERLRDRAAISVVIQGDGLGRRAVEDHVRNRRLANVMLLPHQKWAVVPKSLAMGDIAVICQDAQAAHLSVPSKTYSALAAGSAIIAITPPDSDLAALVTTHRVGVACLPGAPAEVASAIASLADDPVRLMRLRERARSVAQEHFSARVVHRMFVSALSRGMSPA